MYDIRAILQSMGHNVDDDVIADRITTWESKVAQALRQAGEEVPKFSSTLPLNRLPYKTQVALMSEYRDIIGLNKVLTHFADRNVTGQSPYLHSLGMPANLNQRIMNIWGRLSSSKDIDARNPFGRFRNVPTGQPSLIDQIYASLNLQFNSKVRGIHAGVLRPEDELTYAQHHFGFGSINRLDTVRTGRSLPSDLSGKRVMVFDLETAGLRTGQIREVAYSTATIGSAAPAQKGEILFRPTQFQRGTLVHQGRHLNMEEFMAARYGMDVSKLPSGSPGNDFVERMKPFLQQLEQAEVVAGHNIAKFDLDQVFTGLSGTNAYKTDSNFRNYVDSVFEGVRGKMVDTLTLAREAPNLANLKVNKVLQKQGKFSTYSIENLLLETDLVERVGVDKVASAMGWNGTVFTKGLHFGDVDTLLTLGLVEHVADLQPRKLSSYANGPQRKVVNAIIRQVESSAALTGITNIRDESAIHPRVRAAIGPQGHVNPIEQDIMLQRRLGYGVSDEALQRAARGVDSRSLLGTLGVFDRYIGRTGDMSYADALNDRKSPGRAFSRFQRLLKGKNLAFSGLSYEERMMATGMAEITSGIGMENYAKYARDSGISRFSLFDINQIQYSTKSGKVSLPVQVLQQAGLLDRAGDPAMFGLSVVEPTADLPQRAINLTYEIANTGDADSVIGVLDEMNTDIRKFAEVLGIKPESAEAKSAFVRFQEAMKNGRLADNIRTSGAKGVSVAQIYGDGTTADKVVDLLRAVNNREDLVDDEMMRMRLPFMNMTVDELGSGILRTAGAVLDKGLSIRDRINIARNVRLASSLNDPGEALIENVAGKNIRTVIPRQSGYAGLTSNTAIATAARNISNAATEKSAETAYRIFAAFNDKIMPALPRVGIASVALGAGALLYSRKREQDKYDVAFDSMPPEEGFSRYGVADFIRSQQISGYDGYSQQLDPLATASLTENLYYGRVGHTSTSWDRNSAIYGGVL